MIRFELMLCRLCLSPSASDFVNFILSASRICLPRPKGQMSGLEMEANLSFEDYYLHSPSTNINKRVVYVQVSYRGML